jgi:hypothetical protein
MSQHTRKAQRFNFSLRLKITALVAVCMLAALLSINPGGSVRAERGGTVTTFNDGAHPLVYAGGPFFVGNPTPLVGLTCNQVLPCDDYRLTVDVPDGLLDQNQIRVKIEWANPVADFDLFVYQGDRIFASSGSSTVPEVVVLPAVSATYMIRVIPFTPLGSSYTATVTCEPKTHNPAPGGSGLVPAFQNYQAPSALGNNAGEPSIGVHWKNGKVMYEAGLSTLRVTFDDSITPARATWEDKSAPTSKESLDPIMFTDSMTGRTVVSQLLGTDSLSSYTEDDGETWIPNEGGPITSGVDHQTVGGGPFHAPLYRDPGSSPLYPNAIYYCSQQLYTAFCARSDDGGLTYGPTVPIYTTECGGIHGHVKVAPDGTVYVPNHSCHDNQGVAVSEDNGVTWQVRVVPGSTASDWDPSVGIGRNGTLYFGYKDGNGSPRVAVSRNQGRSWGTSFDVGLAFNLRNSAFPAVVAGDDDRAAFAFLGSNFAGNDTRGIWHLYVATTYDGGVSWSTIDATPNDPVQRGTICSGGLSCSGNDRNLLDFMDATVDAQGRILVGYADGCITAQCVSGSKADGTPAPNDFTKKATIARQSGGPGLFKVEMVQ